MMKERILEALAGFGGARTVRQIAEALSAPQDEVEAALTALEADGRAVETRKGGWAIPEAVGLTAAT
ncbi:MAG: hypothetical protein IKN05_09755, partial [Clostridia bacterium]|nr:hypothetical protein [Clostridia bacterium]